MAWFRRKASNSIAPGTKDFYGDRGDPTKGGFYMAADSGSAPSSAGGPDPLVRDVRGSSQESSRFVLTPVQDVNRGNFKQIKNAVENNPGKMYVSDIKLIQREEDLPGILTPVVDVAMAQENVPLTDKEAFNIQGNQKGAGMTVWQHTAMTASALENAKVRGEVAGSAPLPDNWQNKLKAETGGGQQAVRDAKGAVKFDGALQIIPSNTPDYVAHLRPGGANRGDDIVGGLIQEQFRVAKPEGMDEVGAQYPLADIYQVNQNALDNRAGHMTYVATVPFDDADTKNVGALSKDAAMLPLISNDMRNDQNTLRGNYNAEELNNPFGGKVGKFVALDRESVETGAPVTLDTLNNANTVEVGFRLNKDKDYTPLGGYSRVFGRLRVGQTIQDQKQGSTMVFTGKGRNAGPVTSDNQISNAAIMKFNGKDRKQFLESTSNTLNKAAQSPEQKQAVKSMGRPWRKNK